MNRRTWLRTAAGLLAAPAVVRAESLMRMRRRDDLVMFFDGRRFAFELPADGQLVRVSSTVGGLTMSVYARRLRDFDPFEFRPVLPSTWEASR